MFNRASPIGFSEEWQGMEMQTDENALAVVAARAAGDFPALTRLSLVGLRPRRAQLRSPSNKQDKAPVGGRQVSRERFPASHFFALQFLKTSSGVAANGPSTSADCSRSAASPRL